MKKAVVLSSIMAILLVVNMSMASGKPNGTPFDAIWKAITGLQQQIDEINPQFPGAGNIAFISSQGIDWIWALTRNGEIWGKPFDGDWQRDNGDVPIPVLEIVQWEPDHFLDSNGNIWVYDVYYTLDWINIGHP